ncbi:MAG: hypothetical protein HFI38_11620 [Lachnospiraceae bacterium]|jgi:hypothetical protein|nr:hypothetical protein [Lachnospiraceae bacterium]
MAGQKGWKQCLMGEVPAGERKQKAVISVVAMVLMIVFRIGEPAAETMDVIGMILAVAAVSVVLYRFPMTIYLPAIVFVVLAGAGSIYLMYSKLPGWDRFVHYFSGVVLGAIGYTAMGGLLRWRGLPEDQVIMLLSAFVFAGMCAGAWEIGEFSADQFFHMDVQHGNTDTMGDIVCGFLGGMTFCAARLVRIWKGHGKQSEEGI